MQPIETKRKIAKEIVRRYFKDDKGNPFELSDGQADIFNSIFLKEHLRVEIIAPTQYGKSSVIAMAIILRTQAFAEQFAIVAGSQPKADIIMGKVIQHTFDHPSLYSELEYDKKVPLEMIKRERSKKRLTWRGGGEIRTFSGDARNRQRVKESLMGFGSPNVIEDESCLIEDDLHSTAVRMLGGHKDSFLCKIGNPVYKDKPNSHFYRTWKSDKYYKIFIDYHQALREGRYTDEYIAEMRDEMNEQYFAIYYECKFPESSQIDKQGYSSLITEITLDKAIDDTEHSGTLKLGFDVGEGNDENVGTLRSNTFAEVVHKSRTKDTMVNVKTIIDLINRYKIDPANVFVDAVGVGAGVVNRLYELDMRVTAVKWSEKPKEKGQMQYKNLKAENFDNMGRWIRGGGKLSKKYNDDWQEISVIKCKEDTDGKLKIKSKEELRKEGIPSPNVADSLALTFNRSIEDDAPRIW